MILHGASYAIGKQLWLPANRPNIGVEEVWIPNESQPFEAFTPEAVEEDLPPQAGIPDNRLCLSVRQPWAYLIANGIKDVENRTWSTGYRGILWIHASKTIDLLAVDILRAAGYPLPDVIQTGGLVGRTRLLDVAMTSRSAWFNDQGPKSRAWILDTRDSRPIPFQPMRGFVQVFPAGSAYQKPIELYSNDAR